MKSLKELRKELEIVAEGSDSSKGRHSLSLVHSDGYDTDHIHEVHPNAESAYKRVAEHFGYDSPEIKKDFKGKSWKHIATQAVKDHELDDHVSMSVKPID